MAYTTNISDEEGVWCSSAAISIELRENSWFFKLIREMVLFNEKLIKTIPFSSFIINLIATQITYENRRPVLNFFVP